MRGLEEFCIFLLLKKLGRSEVILRWRILNLDNLFFRLSLLFSIFLWNQLLTLSKGNLRFGWLGLWTLLQNLGLELSFD